MATDPSPFALNVNMTPEQYRARKVALISGSSSCCLSPVIAQRVTDTLIGITGQDGSYL